MPIRTLPPKCTTYRRVRHQRYLTMSETRSPNSYKDIPLSTQATPQQPDCSTGPTTIQPSTIKCMKRKLFPSSLSSPPHPDDDPSRTAVTPIKRKRGSGSLGLDSPPSIKPSSSTTTTPSSAQNRLNPGHNVPLSERQQLAMILKMTDEHPQPDVSPKPSSPGPPSHKRTPADKKVNKRNERGETLLHLVAIKGDNKLTKKYLKAGAHVNAQDFAGWTALHEACNHGFVDVAKQLLKAGANVNAQGLDNDTPLHDASGNGHTKLVLLLMKHGANPLQPNCKGKTPVDVAASDEIVQLLRKEVLSSNSECSSVEDIRSPTSPESASSTRDDDHHSNLDDFSARVSSQMAPRCDATGPQLTDPFKKQNSSKSPDSKSHSPRLFLKFQHIKFKDSQSCDSTEPTKETQPYKSYSVTLETSDRTTECFSPFNSASSNGSDSNDSKLDISRRLKAVDASLTEQDDLLTTKREAEPRIYPIPQDLYPNKHPHISTSASGFMSSLGVSDSSRVKPFETSFPPLVMESSAVADTMGNVRPVTYKQITDDSNHTIPSLHSENSNPNPQLQTSSFSEKAEFYQAQLQSRVVDTEKAAAESSSITQYDNLVKTSSILCERTGEQVPDESYLTGQIGDNLCESTGYPENAPKVPPLKIIMPTKSSTLPHDTDTVNCSSNTLPYVVNSANVIESEATSSSAFNLDPSLLQQEQFSNTNIDSTNSVDCKPVDDITSSSTDPSKFMITAAAAESTSLDDNKPASENEASEGSGETKADKEERRITRSLRSHMAQFQQKEKSDKQGSDSNDGNGSGNGNGNGDHTPKSSRTEDITVDDSTDVPPRKRKLRPKPEPVASDIPPPNPTSFYEMPPNPYQIYLSRKRDFTTRQEGMSVVHPKEPQGFKQFLMVSCGYVLQGNTASTLAVPMLSPPNSVSGPMRELFSQQEKARYKLRLQHLVEREKLKLASEQEILRVHGRAARISANQSQPLSVCTVLKDEELYPTTDIEQLEERDKTIRSRYNGRQFLSWLQDVADKYDKLKELLILRHHHEAESLYAVQKMDWEWKMKAVGICEHNITPKIDDLHVPMVTVSDE